MFYFMRTLTTMFYFRFITPVRNGLFFNMLKALKQLGNAETVCFGVFSVLFHMCEPL